MTANSNNIYNPPKDDLNRFYVYLHIDPRNNEVFYVGKGQGNRAWSFYDEEREELLNELNSSL